MIKLLKFSTKNCSPCKTLEKNLNEAIKDIEIDIIDIDAEIDYEFSTQYKIKSVPTLIVVDGDKPIAYLIGNHPTQKIQDFIKTHIHQQKIVSMVKNS